MFHTITNEGVNKVISVNYPECEGTLRVSLEPKIFSKKRIGKEYISVSDVGCLNHITIDVEDTKHFFKLVSGLCSYKEAYRLAWKFNRDGQKEILEFLESTKLIKDLRKLKTPSPLDKNVVIEYLARDGYKISVERVNKESYSIVEYDNGIRVPYSTMYSKQDALSIAAETVEMISKFDNVRFTYHQYQ